MENLYEKFLSEEVIEDVTDMADVFEGPEELLNLIGVACFQAYNRGLKGESLI